MSGSSSSPGVWARLASDEALLEAAANDVLNGLIDEAIRGQAFEIHRAVKTGIYLITDPELAQNEDSNDSLQSVESSTNLSGGGGGGSGTTTPPVGGVAGGQIAVDVFGQAVTTTSGVPALKKQCECVCPNCQRNLAASRFAPHLEKCMGMGRNSSRIASRRLANSANKDKDMREDQDGGGGEDDDDDWIEPTKAVGNRRKRDKNSPRRNRGGSNSRVTSSTASYAGSSNDSSMDTHSGVQTPPLGFESMTPEERNHLLNTVCGVISSNSRKICSRTIKCPFHTESQRRDIRLKWMTHAENDETVDIDSFTEGDTATLRESLAQLSNASSPAESTISTSSNPSANSSLRGAASSRREGKGSGGRSGRGKKGKPGSKGGSRGSTPPLTLID